MRYVALLIVGWLLVPSAACADSHRPVPSPKLKLALSTDFGNENHWRRVIEFAETHDVERLVYWSYGEICGFPTPWSYPQRPAEFLDAGERDVAHRVQASLRRSAKMTSEAGMEFWYVYQALMMPDLGRLRRVAPELFNRHGEPDMSGDAMYALVAEQLEELHTLVPELDGIEVWIMECANVQIFRLAHQRLSTAQIIDRLVATIHEACRKYGWKMTLDLHTAVGNTQTLQAILAAARKRPDVIISGDNVIGDFSLVLPFNEHLREAAKTNRVSVHFDLNGEYWGRNYVPTSALSQYARHLEEARRLGAECVNGRVSTAHDVWSPHGNILPRYRKEYPPFANRSLQVSCTDTLGRLNAHFFCRRARDPRVTPEQAAREFLVEQFGRSAQSLVPVFLQVEEVDRGIFFMDGNYFAAQTVTRAPVLHRMWGWDEHVTSPAGTLLPTEQMKRNGGIAAFAGWPVPVGHRTSGPRAVLAEKAAAQRKAEELLEQVKTKSVTLDPADREFLVRQFEDLVLFARIYRLVAEVEVHSLLLDRNLTIDGLPDRDALDQAAKRLRRVRAEWLNRYPADPWGVAKLIDDGLSRCPVKKQRSRADNVSFGPAEPSEWTIEQARRCWKPMTRAVQHVGVPGYQFQTGVTWDGSLVFGPLEFYDFKVIRDEMAPLGKHLLHVSFGFGDTMRLMDRRGALDPRIRRWLEQGRLPIPHVETRDGDLAWHETVFAHLLDRPTEPWPEPKSGDVLVTHAVFRVRNAGAARRTGHLWMHFGDTKKVAFGYKCRQLPELAQPIEFHFDPPHGRLGDGVRFVLPKPDKGELRFHAEVKEVEGAVGPARGVVEWSVPLAPGEEAELRLLIPFGVADLGTAQKIAALDSRKTFNEVRRWWNDLQRRAPGQIQTPDPFVNDYLAALVGQVAQQVAWREHTTQVWMYKTSPNLYEKYWPVNGAKSLPVFDMRGLTWLNRRLLQSVIDMRTDEVGGLNREGMGSGKVLAGEGYAKVPGFLGDYRGWTANPLLLSHGLNLCALVAHYRITRDDAWLRSGNPSPLAVMIEAFDWITAQRRRTMRTVNGRRVAHCGLLPAASAHDWLAGNTIFNDAYCVVGQTEVVRLLREIGHPRAEEMAREMNDYRRCLHDRYAEARDRARRLPLDDGTTIPYVPRVIQELDWAKPDWTYTGYSAVRAGAWGALDPRDELVDQALAFLEAGLPRGEGYYYAGAAKADNSDVNMVDVSDPAAPRHYLWRHYVEYETMWPVGAPLFLARDDLPRFFEWFAHNFAFAIHQDFRVGVESLDGVPSCAPADTERWLAVRNMFVREDGGYDGSAQSLWLLQAIPREWLKPGDRLSARRIFTYFGGQIDVALHVAADGRSVTVEAVLGKMAVRPKEIRMRLRSGDGTPLTLATVNGAAVPIQPGDTILLPADIQGAIRVVGRFE